jgi:hypothetical protein
MMSSRGGGLNGGRGGGRRPHQRKKTFKLNVKGERNKPRKKKPPPRGGNGNNKSGLGFVLLSAFVATTASVVAFALFRAKKHEVEQQENIRERLKSKPLSVTNHGACRMDCRFVSHSDVKLALAKGSLSKKHSTFPERKFAFENGRVRAIFGENEDATTVVTVIDVDTDHPCGPC